MITIFFGGSRFGCGLLPSNGLIFKHIDHPSVPFRKMGFPQARHGLEYSFFIYTPPANSKYTTIINGCGYGASASASADPKEKGWSPLRPKAGRLRCLHHRCRSSKGSAKRSPHRPRVSHTVRGASEGLWTKQKGRSSGFAMVFESLKLMKGNEGHNNKVSTQNSCYN